MTDTISGSSKSAAPETAVSTEVALVEAPPVSASTERASRPGARPLRALLNLLHDLAIAVVICVFLIAYVVQAFKVQGSSMAPELVDGERILVNKFLYRLWPIERGDVVVFWYPEDPEVSFIKRVVALPGDRIEIRAGKVFVNGASVKEPYVKAEFADERSYPPREVRAGHYFVLGDNRQGSNDSRSWGYVPERYIYGKAFFCIWPLDQIGIVE
jgi:signal peptidase I